MKNLGATERPYDPVDGPEAMRGRTEGEEGHGLSGGEPNRAAPAGRRRSPRAFGLGNVVGGKLVKNTSGHARPRAAAQAFGSLIQQRTEEQAQRRNRARRLSLDSTYKADDTESQSIYKVTYKLEAPGNMSRTSSA